MAVSLLFSVVSGSSISVRGVLLRLAFDENPSAVNISHLFLTLSVLSFFPFIFSHSLRLRRDGCPTSCPSLSRLNSFLCTHVPYLFYVSAAALMVTLCLLWTNELRLYSSDIQGQFLQSVALEQPSEPRDVKKKEECIVELLFLLYSIVIFILQYFVVLVFYILLSIIETRLFSYISKKKIGFTVLCKL